MPNTKSAKKRLRQNEHRRMHNKSFKSNLRSSIRKVREAVDGGNLEQAEEHFRHTARKLDQAGSKKIIHANAAARYKARLQHLIRKAKQGETAS